MSDKFVKVNVPKVDCRNIYFVNNDELFGGKEPNKAPTYISRDFKLLLRVTHVNRSGVREQTKKTFSFTKKITFLQALKEVSSYREALLKKLKEGTHKEDKVKIPTLRQAWDDYVMMKKNQLSPNTLVSYTTFMNKWILSKPTLAKTSIDKVATKKLQLIVNEILESGKSPRTAQSVKQILRPLFKQYVFNGTINLNPADLIQIPKFDNQMSVELSDEEVKRLYEALYNYPTEPFRCIFIWLSHGRRQNEILSLEWSDISIENRTYTIKPENNKVRKPMTYQLSDSLLETLQIIGVKKSGYVFHAMKDETKKMNKGTIRNHWENVLKELNIHIRMHDLRHLIGGTLVSSGKTLEQVASVLGHTSTSVTKRYSKVRQEVAAESLDDFFKRVR
jgi:site-specific recombinase XerD